ncbi:hypothetical protein FACS1894198_6250 [Clostridia bacterium]|nr:hypothetical protein FACS1894198_6250 [Clostridia bacterium]
MNMICMRDVSPDWDSLPVWTMKNYEHSGYLNEPFVQVRACYVAQTGFHLRVTAYENAANYVLMENYKGNQITLVCNFGLTKSEELSVIVSIDGKKSGFEDVDCKMLQGEDLQGVFWGVDVSFSNSVIKEHMHSGRDLTCGDSISFNIFKRWLTSKKYFHSGKLFNEGECCIFKHF